MNTSPRRKLPFERKAMFFPSFEIAGARKICPSVRRSVSSGCENLRGRCSCATGGRNSCCIASRHSSLSSSSEVPSSRLNARSMPTLGTAWRIWPIVWSPQRAPMNSQSASP